MIFEIQDILPMFPGNVGMGTGTGMGTTLFEIGYFGTSRVLYIYIYIYIYINNKYIIYIKNKTETCHSDMTHMIHHDPMIHTCTLHIHFQISSLIH